MIVATARALLTAKHAPTPTELQVIKASTAKLMASAKVATELKTLAEWKAAQADKLTKLARFDPYTVNAVALNSAWTVATGQASSGDPMAASVFVDAKVSGNTAYTWSFRVNYSQGVCPRTSESV